MVWPPIGRRMSDEPIVPAPVPTPVLGAATVRLVIDLRRVEDRPLHALRLLLVADVKRRLIEETQRGRVITTVVGRPGVGDSLKAVAQQLGIPEASRVTLAADVAAPSLVARPEIALRPETGPGAGPGDVPAGQTWDIAAATERGHAGDPSLSQLIEDRDPLALRLALLRLPYSTPVVLSAARLHRAEESLERWRFKVAGWERMPPAPAPAGSIEAMVAALDTVLDTGAVLRSLHRLEVDHTLASGGKYEAFRRLDRVLALDLGRLVGRPHI